VTKNGLYILLAIHVIFFLGSCATPGTPDGGPRDEEPPKMDSLISTPNLQTNFVKQQLEFTFNEWVKLNKPTTEVLVSPPFVQPLKFSIRKKTVRVEFPEDEELKENTTYTINFGDAVQDLTESNPVPDFRFVFSTGDEIDSLSMKGLIIDAITGEPVADARMFLYYNQADSVVRTEKPYYFAKADKEGKFKISNLPGATFKGFVLEDQNLDYKFNGGERIGFPDSLIIVKDTFSVNLTIKLFAETPNLEFVKNESESFGQAKLRFNREPFGVQIKVDDSVSPYFHESDKDTLKLWYNIEEPFNVFVSDSTGLLDTVNIKPPSKEEFIAGRKLKQLRYKTTGSSSNELLPNQAFQIIFNHPLLRFDTAGIQVLKDSLPEIIRPDIQIDENNPRTLLVSHNWKEASIYKFELAAGAVTDWFGLTCDTLRNEFNVPEVKELGVLNINVVDLDSTQTYTLELLGKSDKLVASYLVQDQSSFKTTLSNMPPGTYTLKMIEDLNGNGRWDPGNYDLKLQPERLFEKALEELRANWEVEAEVIPVFN